MTISAPQFRSCVIDPSLNALASAGVPVSKIAADLLMATAAVETELGTYLQYGPAQSVFWIELKTLDSTLQRASRDQLQVIQSLAGTKLPIWIQISGNMILAAAIARLVYWQSPMELPPNTPVGLWNMYNTVWNITKAAATTKDQFMIALELTDITFTTEGSVAA